VAIPGNKTAVADLDAKDVTLQGAVIRLDDPLLGQTASRSGSCRAGSPGAATSSAW